MIDEKCKIINYYERLLARLINFIKSSEENDIEKFKDNLIELIKLYDYLKEE